MRNLSLFVLPFLAGYFARRRQLAPGQWVLTAAPFVLAALVINLYPYGVDSTTEMLVALHLPVVLWFAVAYPYMGGTLRSHERRMDFVRFTGEWFIYYVLIALGGGVLMALTAAILEPTGVDVDRVAEWVVPSGAAGAVIVAAWLVESKQRVVENMAPVLTMLFTPLFAVMLAASAVVYAVTGLGDAFDRDLVSVFDALLLVVLALVLYGMSARDPSTSPNWMDRIQLVAVVSALVLDLMVLGAMVARIGDVGFSPNRTAALGLNLVLLVNLAGAAWLSARFLTAAHPAPPARALADDLPSRLRALGRRGRGHPAPAVRLRLSRAVAAQRSVASPRARVASRPLALAGTPSGVGDKRAVGQERLVLRDRRRRTPAAVRPAGRARAMLQALAAERETAIVLTAPWHERDAESLVERLGVPVYTPLPDTAQYLMDTYGITAEQAGDGSPDVVWLLREGKGEARPYAPGDRLPFGADVFPGHKPNDTVLWVESHGAVISGDTLVDFGRGLEINERWLRPA